MGLRTALAAFALAFASAPASAEDDAVAAKKLFEEGRALLAQGKLAEACPVFDRSYALDAAPGTALNVADCAERNGDVARARQLYEDAARAFDKARQPGRASFARNRLANLDKLKPVAPAKEPPAPPAEPDRSAAREMRHETEGTVSAPATNHRISKPLAIIAGAITVIGGATFLYAGHTGREYSSGTGAVNGAGRALGSSDCGSETPIAGDVEGFYTACRWRARAFVAAPAMILGGVTTIATLIYIAATPSRPAGGVALRPVVTPSAAGATLAWSF